MMMILYRRHRAGCAGCRCRKERKRECHCCRCPIWIDGRDHEIQRSLDTGDWARAERERAKIEASWQDRGVLELPAAPEPISVNAACQEFLSDALSRGLRDSTRYK